MTTAPNPGWVDLENDGKEKEKQMSFFDSIRTVFAKYADFRGTARRSEFWWWILFTALVDAGLNAVPLWRFSMLEGAFSSGPSLSAVWMIIVLLPTLAVTVRRLTDAGSLWGHVFWALLPLAGLIVLAILCAQPSRTSPQRAASAAESPRVYDAER
ncbi:MAG: hypothetical protein JWR33_891 [Naasia sp.]|nr:hypothetical protein [Naasia sp.]